MDPQKIDKNWGDKIFLALNKPDQSFEQFDKSISIASEKKHT
jgi:hypothetical protein